MYKIKRADKFINLPEEYQYISTEKGQNHP